MKQVPNMISTKDLSYRDKYNILFSPNGRLSHYEKYLKGGHETL